MSMRSWKKEFYGDMKKACKTKMGAIKHSLKKWEGLRPDNLSKHGISINMWGGLSYRDIDFDIDETSCALCEKYFDDRVSYGMVCKACPLQHVLGRRCDCPRMPYCIWQDSRNPEPMIRALKKTLRG